MGDERRTRTEVEYGPQFVPGVVLRGDLRERTDREPARQPVGLVEHGGDMLRIGQQRQPVLGECRGGPQLAARLDRMARPIPDAQQPGPVAGAAAVVDHAHEAVEVGAVDQFVEGVVVGASHDQTNGHG